jgi:hypothetical protein
MSIGVRNAKAEPLPFEVNPFSVRTTGVAEGDYKLAGGHPDANITEFKIFPREADIDNTPVEQLKDSDVYLPAGFVGNPAVAARCPAEKVPPFAEFFPGQVCPVGSMVGQVIVNEEGFQGLYNVAPDRGYPAEFIFNKLGTKVPLYATVHPRTEMYRLSVGTTNAIRLPVKAIEIDFYGVPGQHGSGGTEAPFLSNPVDCSASDPTWKGVFDSWEHAGLYLPDGTPDLDEPNWTTLTFPASPVEECDRPALVSEFDPSIATKPLQAGGLVQADQPSGLAVDIDFPQSNDPTDPEYISGAKDFDPSTPQAPEPKDITVKLPAGLSISPSSADGLGACSDLASDPAGDQVHYDSIKPVTCPESAKIGTAVATSPLLALRHPVTDEVTGAEPIPGDVYLLKPHAGDLSPAGNRDGKFRLLIQLENARYGVNFKLPGIAIADKQTGQLTATFTDAPQLPSKHLTVTLKSGPRAPLATPVTCGKFATAANFVPWGTPEVPDANRSASFEVKSGPNGSGCVSSLGQRPFAPTLSAGTESSKAGASTPFVMKLTRNDGEQELSSLDLTTPKGFSAKLAGIPYCADAAIAAASSKSGVAEQASPSCPAASQVGTITAGAGPGTNPYYVGGKAYLAGPYKGAPLSLAFITPAVAGPFDLGNVVVRAALQVNPETAQVTVKTDPLPQIIDGVPLRLRSVTARIDRPNFALNPTNCEPMLVNATVAGASGATATPSNSFQVGRCKELSFKPGLSLALKGETKRTGNPSVRATVTYPKGGSYANIAKTTVLLPPSEFIDNAHINNPCTRVQFNANQCPKSSILGTATAYTPLLDQPLTGPVYFRANGGERDLPDMVVDLNGQIHVTLVGFIDSVPIKGTESARVRTRFATVPDAPVSKFVLKLYGGKHGLIENSKNLCKGTGKATVQMLGQNGKVNDFDTALKTSCAKKAKGQARPAPDTHRLLPRFGF